MTALEELLAPLRVRSVRGTRTITWFGTPVTDLDDPAAPANLASVLYSSAYVLGGPAPRATRFESAPDERWPHVRVDPRMDAVWGGWTVTTADRLEQAGQPAITMRSEPGASVALPLPPTSESAIPGWLLVRHGDVAASRDTYRIYLNTDPDLLLPRIERLTAVLVERVGGFSAKFLTSYQHLVRADSTVIYLPALPTRQLVEAVVGAVGGAIVPGAVPMFTHQVAPGVAIAPSPADGRSFGEEITLRIAEAVVASRRAGRSPVIADLRLPAWPVIDPHRAGGASRRPPSDPRDGVLAFTDRLARDALTGDGMASWLIRSPDGRHRSMGPEVYAGAAGPLLALAHAVPLAGPGTRELMRSVGRTMLARQDELPAAGFHSGRAGVAAALAEAAWLTDDDQLREFATRSLRKSLASPSTGREWDVLGGVAGTLLATHAAGALLGVDVGDHVRGLATRLVDAARPDLRSGGLRWPSRIGGRIRSLAGLAHGGTGAALALSVASGYGAGTLELVRRTIAFEDNARMDERGWLDFRADRDRPHFVAWCHGAAGIGLGTIGIAAHLPGDAAIEARIGRAAEWTAQHLGEGVRDDNLCHGWGGTALALTMMCTALGRPAPDLGRIPESHAHDLGLMTGEPGRWIARLALAGHAPAPLAFVLTPQGRFR